MTDIYKIAGKTIAITSLYNEVHVLCKDYRFNGTPDFTVQTFQEDIDFERKKSAVENPQEIYNFSDSYLETLAVYRKIADKLIDYDIILFHGSVVAVDGTAYLFTAKSGTGKSTHTKLWREYFGERAVMVNDDKPLIYIGKNDIIVYGTPWDGKHRLSTNISVPLNAICILTRSAENHIEKISKSDAYAMLIQQSNRPVAKIEKTLSLIDKMAKQISLYKLGCNMEIQAVEVAYNGMKGKIL